MKTRTQDLGALAIAVALLLTTSSTRGQSVQPPPPVDKARFLDQALSLTVLAERSINLTRTADLSGKVSKFELVSCERFREKGGMQGKFPERLLK